MSDDYKRIINGSCWIIPVVISWLLISVFTVTIGAVDDYPILLVLPVVAFVLLFYASYEYGKWYSSNKDK